MANRFLRAALVAGIAAAALEPFLFVGSFAGDAQVHLVFAESASHGRFFEFNPGERVSGETSPGYMLLEAVLFRVFPPRVVPVAVKVLNLAAWYLLCLLIYRVACRTMQDPGRNGNCSWPVIAALTSALIPGSVYNANVGMENGLFAALVWAWVDRAMAWNWFYGEPVSANVRAWPREMASAAILGVSCWIRPEGLVIVALAYGYRLWKRPVSLSRWVTGAAAASLVGIAAFAFETACTGDTIPTSILSRRLLSMHRSIDVGPLRLDPAFVERLLIYLPLTAYFALDLRRRPTRSPTESFLLAMFATFFVMYTVATGGAQLSRYAIFLMPILAIPAARRAWCEWCSGDSRRKTAVVAAATLFMAANIIESTYRATTFHELRSSRR